MKRPITKKKWKNRVYTYRTYKHTQNDDDLFEFCLFLSNVVSMLFFLLNNHFVWCNI
ncbi:hypothetical protein BDA99DRAFT_503685 [Phascolomyces articulosus]|uniref:Uncharacterized protein n=1 Tax=Phascolomyces articulosus TaxID=60185 RepID=A0AAD5K565_9FUNG|nr:hypothetical protein BDA99DRAFT_503685 [Phascolomyces articulosus]